MSIILWVIFGALAGLLASIITGAHKKQKVIGNVVVGIMGALVGGLLVNLTGDDGAAGLNISGISVAVIGSITLLFGYKAIQS